MAVLTLTAAAIDTQQCEIYWVIEGIVVANCASWAAIAKTAAANIPISNYSNYLYDTGNVYGSGSDGYATGYYTVNKTNNPSSFTCYGAILSVNSDIWYSAGGGKTVATVYASARPSTFSWTYTKVAGNTFILTPGEWNNFFTNINAVRVYKGYSTVWYTSGSTGYPFTSNMYDQAHSAINEMYYSMSSTGQSYINAIPSWSTGQIVTANHFNYLVTALNSIA